MGRRRWVVNGEEDGEGGSRRRRGGEGRLWSESVGGFSEL